MMRLLTHVNKIRKSDVIMVIVAHRMCELLPPYHTYSARPQLIEVLDW